MSQSLSEQHTNQEPKTIYLKDYQVSPFLIDTVHLQFDLQDDCAIVTSQMTMRHNPDSQDHSHILKLNGEELKLESIKLNDAALQLDQYHISDQILTINNVPNHFKLEIVTKIYPKNNTALSGLYFSKGKYSTQCEAEGFRRITYFLDRPDVLAKYTTTISAEIAHFPYLLSNGNLIHSKRLDGNRHTATWEDPFKKPSYLFALVAGDFDVIEDQFMTQSNRKVLLRIYVEKGNKEEAYHAMFSLQEAMRWDEITYGREYDLDIYMIVAIHDFNMGAMENKGLNIFNTKYVLARPETATDHDFINVLSVIGHEYFHNWSGNRVTCRDWFQLSLKEGLTIFRDQSFTEDLISASIMRIQDVTYLREVQFPEDASPLAHPVCPKSYIEINNFYTATVYNKGAEVLRMLQTILGKKLFRQGMELYFSRFDGKAATIENYIQVMEEVSGINLKQFRLWYDEAGTPEVTVDSQYDADKKIYTLNMHQTHAQSEQNPLHIPIRMALLNEAGDEIENEKVIHLTQTKQSFSFQPILSQPIPSLLRGFSAPIKLNYTYTDQELLFLLKHDHDPFNRFEAWQRYLLRTILNLIHALRQNDLLVIPQELFNIYSYLYEHDQDDQFFIAEMYRLPSMKYIGEQMDCIDIEAIFQAREFLAHEIAKQLQSLFKSIYQQYAGALPQQFSVQHVGARQLKNISLTYLMRLPQHTELGMQQFSSALQFNMTDTETALIGLSHCDSPLRLQAFHQFYATWKHDALVIDKWFAIQAESKLPGVQQEVKKLMRHQAFDIKNPNCVYALIGAFTHRNLIHFHSADGSGYQFLREVVEEIDQFNPQIAARMIKPLTTWKRYDKNRQSLMCIQLRALLNSRLSSDLYELITKSLE